MTAASIDGVASFLSALNRGDEQAIVALLEPRRADGPAFAPLLRAAAFHPSRNPLYYRRLWNTWSTGGRPSLKPAPRRLQIEVLADGTVNGLAPYLELFCALYGLDVRAKFGDYDSVEHVAFASPSTEDADVTIVILSEYWFRRRLPGHLIARQQLDETKEFLGSLLDGLQRVRSGHVLICACTQGPWPSVSGTMSSDRHVGFSVAAAELFTFLASRASNRCHLVDCAAAIHAAGGADSLGARGYLLMRAPFGERALVGLAREASSGLSQLFGRSHRALLTDWDNTIWGGEVGEVGPKGVVCGQESPDGLGYFLLQAYLRDLNAAGVLLAAVSRNAAGAAGIFEQNPDLALRREHFVSLALSWGNKSDSISAVQSELGFGVEFMLYIDDSLVDLAEVLTTHGDIDIVPAGPNPDQTLDRLSAGRYFSALRVTDDDVQRPRRTAALLEQREVSPGESAGGFLQSLRMRLSAIGLTDVNKPRLLQLLQKTNQFNLTTRRHTEQDITGLVSRGATITAFSYADRFGSQGIIGLVILVPDGCETVVIDTWLMSCRVLNRGVEEAMFEWISRHADGRTLIGHYAPTEKNSVVKDLYDRLGFALVDAGPPLMYRLEGEEGRQWTADHHLECVDA